MSVDLVWEEPPAETLGRGASAAIDRVVETLKGNPGKWARVEDAASSSSAVAKWKKRGCEALARHLPREKGQRDYKYAIYVRWPAPDPKAVAKTATPQELAAAYAQKHGAGLAPGREKLAPPAGEEPDVTRTGEDTPPAVTQAWKNRLGHGKGNR